MNVLKNSNQKKKNITQFTKVFWKIESMFRWVPEDFPLYDFLLERAGSHQQLQKDMFHLVGTFVEYGLIIFKEVGCAYSATSNECLLELFQKYKIGECDAVTDPKISISDVPVYFPLYVAECLDLELGCPIDTERVLPKCLAFPGGLHMIPEDPKWESLVVLWKLWRSALPMNVINAIESVSYMKINYYMPNAPREQFMEAFCIEEISDYLVLQRIKRQLLRNSFKFIEYSWNLTVFKEVFPIFAVDIHSYFHSKLSTDAEVIAFMK